MPFILMNGFTLVFFGKNSNCALLLRPCLLKISTVSKEIVKQCNSFDKLLFTSVVKHTRAYIETKQLEKAGIH